MELTSTQEKIVSVGQLTHSIKALLEGGLGAVSVRGEISNWKPASSGHIYFSLKDSEAMISAALFRGAASKLRNIQLRDGVEVIARGRISVYPPRGSYQIIVDSLEPVGAGSLQAAFEALKKKLFAEGLFDAKRKKPIPKMPQKIVVITSPTGAAIRDVLSVFQRRFAGLNALIIPTLVQGAEAAKDLVKAVETANAHKLGDVILLTRGGGSLEDLWCFNDEALARAIAASDLPIVSAVGHEVDFTIADFVADLRAPTPSAAAEILTQEHGVLLDTVLEQQARLVKSIRTEFSQAKLRLQAVSSKLKNPKDRINELRLRFDDWSDRLQTAVHRSLEKRKDKLKRAEISLTALSPLQVLERGYAIVLGKEGKVRKSIKQVKSGDPLTLRLADGVLEAEAK